MLTKTALEKLDLFLSQFKPIMYRRRSIISHGDNIPAHIYFLKNGYLRVYRISEEGEELTLVILEPNDFFPLIWDNNNLFSDYYLEALTDTEVWKVSREQFLKFIQGSNDVLYDLMDHALLRFGVLLTRMEYLITSRAATKVATTILVCAKRFGEQQGNAVVVKLPLTHKDIATLVGITRETTCLEMKKLERKGLIAHAGRSLVIKDMGGLEEESLPASEKEWLFN